MIIKLKVWGYIALHFARHTTLMFMIFDKIVAPFLGFTLSLCKGVGSKGVAGRLQAVYQGATGDSGRAKS